MGVDTWKQPFRGNYVETAVDYTVDRDDNVIIVTASKTVTLDYTAFDIYEWKRIMDGSGNASTGNITITPDTGTINGAGSLTIAEDYGAMDVMWDGTNYFAIAKNNGVYAGTMSGSFTGPTAGTHTGRNVGNVTGNLLGNVTGNVLGDVVGNVTGNVLGDLVGNVTGSLNVPASVTGDPIMLNGTARVWDDMLKFTASNIPKNPLTSVPVFNYDEVRLEFANTSVETVVGEDQMPHGYKLGSDVRPHIHFYRNETGRARFRLAYKWYDNLAGWVPWTVIYGSSTYLRTYANTTGYPQILMFPMLSGANVTRHSSIFKFKLTRMGNVTQDTHHGEFWFDEFDLHGQKDRIGTKDEYS